MEALEHLLPLHQHPNNLKQKPEVLRLQVFLFNNLTLTLTINYYVGY